MRINFVLPRTKNKPMGGYKIVYQYAKRLADDGNDVHIYYLMQNNRMQLSAILKKIQGLTFERGKYRNVNWFNLEGVKLHFDQTIDSVREISQGKIIATHWSTAKIVSESRCNDLDKFYFIQGYEIFDPMVTKEKLDNTWRLPLKKIVVSEWLMNKAKELDVNSETYMVKNFIDTNEFPIFTEYSDKRDTVSFLWHNNPQKQSKWGIEIAKKVKERYPNIKITMFGVDIPNDNYGDLEVVNNASVKKLNDIYKRSIVYFMPSKKEGWGLTGMEAMALGAAVVTVDNGGIWEYANRESAKIVENDIEQLECAIFELIDNKEERIKQVNVAKSVITQMTLEKQTLKLLAVLKNNG